MTYPQQQGPYGQQYGGYQHPGQHGGYGGPPPKKSNSAAIAIVIVVVAALAGLGITGFVAPGFFLGDDEKSTSSGGSGDSGADNGDSGGGDDGGASGIDEFAKTLAQAANEQDKATLKGFKCADATDVVDEAIAAIGQTDGAKLSDTTKVSDDEYTVVITISYKGDSQPFAATVTKAENGWCWQDFAPGNGSTGNSGSDADSAPESPSSGDDKAAGGSADGEAFVLEFLDAVNAKDAATAEGMICSDAPSNSLVEYVISKNPQLELAGVDQSGSTLVSYELDGTVDGKPLTNGTVSVRTSGSGSPCVFTFIAG